MKPSPRAPDVFAPGALVRRAAWRALLLGGWAAFGFLVGCAAPSAEPPVAIPAALAVPTDEVLITSVTAVGVQVYQCQVAPARASGHDWVLKAPDAVLSDAQGRPMGTHFAGPTWAAIDGSKVMGEVLARSPSPNGVGITWLLLRATSTTGPGVFSAVRSIQRVRTEGGEAPTTACNANHLQDVARVPYKAVYHFHALRSAP